jgi:hypothetical protein
MPLRNKNRENLLKEVVSRIEAEFPGSLVVWTGTGSPDDDYQDDTEWFEAYMIQDNDLARFEEFTWQLNEEIAEPNGFAIMVHGLNPEITLQYRLEEYNAEKAKRAA